MTDSGLSPSSNIERPLMVHEKRWWWRALYAFARRLNRFLIEH